jgi:hypothetical protein
VKNNRCPPDEGAVLLERDEFGAVKFASAAAEAWIAQRLVDALTPSTAKQREATDAKDRALARAKAERVDVQAYLPSEPLGSKPRRTGSKKATTTESDEVPYEE